MHVHDPLCFIECVGTNTLNIAGIINILFTGTPALQGLLFFFQGTVTLSRKIVQSACVDRHSRPHSAILSILGKGFS